MSPKLPTVGTVLGEFDAVLDRARTWRVDWTVGLDVPEYLDDEVARCAGWSDIVVPPGALIFFSFLDGTHWLDTADIHFDRSLAVRRVIRNHRPLCVGDRVHGTTVISAVDVRTTERSTIVDTTISTTYEHDGLLAVEEMVTYSTRSPHSARDER